MKRRDGDDEEETFDRGEGSFHAATPTARLDRSKVNWDHLRIFVRVVEAGSVRGASEPLGIDQATIRKRLSSLEESLGNPLILKSPGGIHLTDFGEMIFESARKLALSVADLERNAPAAGAKMAGRVRMSFSEGLGTYWIAPRLIPLQRAYPNLTFDLKFQVAEVLSAETDISVQYVRPRNSDAIAVRLGTLHALFFASASYVEKFGIPRTIKDLSKHKIISQHLFHATHEDKLLGQIGISRPEGAISFRVDSSVATAMLVQNGAGIGSLGSYAACIESTLVPIEIEGMGAKLEIWMAYHPQAKKSPRIAMMIDWLADNFDKKRFPWFRDEYVSPARLKELPNDDWKVNIVR